MRLRRKSLQPKSAEEPSDVPALLIECQHVAVLSSAWPLWAGPHTCYNGNYNGKQGCKAERIRKDCLSSDCSLQLGNMKLESLVIADQHAAVNMYPGPVHTARHTPWE
ncbi:hypothetical protein L1887_59034 [Cichorium endivia]|nr:hypothetical protein L1887_59034 [Cichorium endivia]